MWHLPGQHFEFRFVEILPDVDFILPTLKLTFNRSSKSKENEQPQEWATITNLNMQISVKLNESYAKVIGYAKPSVLQQKWKSNEQSQILFYLTLDNVTLYEIEKIRRGGNLNLNARLTFQAYPLDNPSDIESYPVAVDIPISKSKWVEEILPHLNYKNVALVELPRLEYPGMNKAVDALNSAWKSYSMGDTDDVLVKCRKVIEELGNQVILAGFDREEPTTDKSGKKYMEKRPDWKSFFNSNSKGDIIKNITKKMSWFVAPGAHIGSGLEMNHAYFALLQTFSLTHLIISRLKMIEQQKDLGKA